MWIHILQDNDHPLLTPKVSKQVPKPLCGGSEDDLVTWDDPLPRHEAHVAHLEAVEEAGDRPLEHRRELVPVTVKHLTLHGC